MTAAISWVTKKPPWSGASKVLGYNPSIRYIPKLGGLLIVLISKPSSYGRRQPTLLFSLRIYDIFKTILIIQYSEAIHIIRRTIPIKNGVFVPMRNNPYHCYTSYSAYVLQHETVSTSPMEYLFLCRTIHTIHINNNLVSVLMKQS